MKMGTQNDFIEIMLCDRAVRRSVVQESFYWFFHIYFSHYIKYETAPFQKEIFSLLENEDNPLLVFVAFRGSGKSTIVTMAYVLWSILGRQQKKYVVVAGLTQRQARQHLQNIKQELESNSLLRNDLGPFREEHDEWGSLSLVISNHGAKMTAASTEQSIRGMRHGAYRPDLIICDDIEDISSVQTQESREKTYRWFTGDVIPAGDRSTRTVVVGNMLHEDSLIMKLKEGIENKNLAGLFKSYPLLDSSSNTAWPAKFPDETSLTTEKQKIGNLNAWMREYLLVILPEENQIIFSEWIQYYESLPVDSLSFRYTIAAADLAISKRQTADFTAIPVAKVYGWGDNMKIYILPYPINLRIGFPEQVEKIKALAEEHKKRIKILIESNGYQKALIETLEKERYPVEGIQTYGQDKRARLSLVTPLLKSGSVFFPKEGADILIQQLVGFGVEKHDDLADAFAMLLNYCIQENRPVPGGIDEFIKLNPRLAEYNPEALYNKRF